MKNSRLLLLAVCLCLPARALAQVPYSRLAKADAEPQSWLTYSGNYQAHRFSKLTEITPANVG
ncbi:MAG: PQQ-dependent dehydrogenase, methanol/ethanol family, partial [Blastocatellia bacterium]